MTQVYYCLLLTSQGKSFFDVQGELGAKALPTNVSKAPILHLETKKNQSNLKKAYEHLFRLITPRTQYPDNSFVDDDS